MPVIGTPIPTTPGDGAYLSVADARALAATLGVTLPADDDTLAAALLVASLDIDAAMRYQGRKYLTDGTQKREFPRVVSSCQFPVASTENVLDWDAEASEAVVPEPVKMAVVYQAEWASSATSAEAKERLQKIATGLKRQKIDTAEEEYATPAELAAGLQGAAICERSLRLMQAYRLRSGALL